MSQSNRAEITDVAIVVVIYNVALIECPTINCLIESSKWVNLPVKLIIYDNSSIKQLISNIPSLDIISYIHDPANPGISKAYNTAADIAVEHNLSWLLFFDQDSTFDKKALQHYVDSINAKEYFQLFAPIVYLNKRVISPSKFLFRRGRPPGNLSVGANKLTNLSPINSGLLVKLSLFQEAGGYNERTPLDYSDFEFISRVKKITLDFFIINIGFEHSLSSYEKLPIDSAIFRYQSFCKGLFNSDKHLWDRCCSIFVALRRCIKLTVVYRRFSFLKVLFFNIPN